MLLTTNTSCSRNFLHTTRKKVVQKQKKLRATLGAHYVSRTPACATKLQMFMVSHKLAAIFAGGCTDSNIGNPSAIIKGPFLWRLQGSLLWSNAICTPTCVQSATRVDWGISTVCTQSRACTPDHGARVDGCFYCTDCKSHHTSIP